MKFEQFFRELCSSLDDENISFLVLRNYELLPLSFGNDIDLLVLPIDTNKVKEIIIKVGSENHFFCKSERQRFNFQSLELYNQFDPKFIIKMDVFSGLTKGWISYMNVDEIFLTKIERECFYVPSLETEIYCLIMKEMYMYGYVRSKYEDYFKKKFKCINLNILKSLLDRHLNRKSSEYIINNLDELYTVKYFPKPKLKLFFSFDNIVKWLYLNIKDKLVIRRELK